MEVPLLHKISRIGDYVHLEMWPAKKAVVLGLEAGENAFRSSEWPESSTQAPAAALLLFVRSDGSAGSDAAEGPEHPGLSCPPPQVAGKVVMRAGYPSQLRVNTCLP